MSIFSNTFLLSALQLCNSRFGGKQATELILAASSSSEALAESEQHRTGRRFVALAKKKRKILDWSLSRAQELTKHEQIVDRSARESEAALMVPLLFDKYSP